MLRLHVYCSTVPDASGSGQVIRFASSRRHGASWLVQLGGRRKLLRGVSVKALKDERGGGSGSPPGRSWEPEPEIEVPFEQRPVSLLFMLKSHHETNYQFYESLK